MQVSGFDQESTFFAKDQKQIFTLFQLKSSKNNFGWGLTYEPGALMVPALGGLVYFMSISLEITVKICVGALLRKQRLF